MAMILEPPQVFLNRVYIDRLGKEWTVVATTHQNLKDKPPIVIHLKHLDEVVNVSLEVFMSKVRDGTLKHIRDEKRGEYNIERVIDLPSQFKYVWRCE